MPTFPSMLNFAGFKLQANFLKDHDIPSGDETSIAIERFWAALKDENATPSTALLEAASKDVHPWIVWCLGLIDIDLRNHQSGFLNNLLSDGLNRGLISQEFFDYVVDFNSRNVMPIKSSFFQIGKNWVRRDVVCASLPPDRNELVQAWFLLANLVKTACPVLESLKICGEMSTHPWMIMLFSIAHEEFRDGHALSSGIRDGIKRFHRERSEALKNNMIANENAHFFPNFLAFINFDLQLIEIGEETGELDKVLDELTLLYIDSGEYVSTLSPALNEFINKFTLLIKSGLPVLRSLKMLVSQEKNYNLKNELNHISKEIEDGATISEAIEKIGGTLAVPLVLGFIKAGETSGNLEIMLEALSVL